MTLRGNVKPLASQLSIAQGRILAFQRRANAAMRTVQAVFSRAAFFAGVGLVAALGKATAELAEFQGEVSELAKLVGQRVAEPLAASLREFSETAPVGQSALLDVAAAAARLGIRGRENIQRFSRVMTEVGVATDATAQEAAEALSRIAFATETPITQVRNLASAINAFANQAPRTFTQIQEAALRAAPALSRMGAATPEIVALAGQLASVSASSARAGTRLRRLAQELQELGNIEGLAAALEMVPSQFRQMVETDPTAVIKRLAQAFREGGAAADRIRQALGSASEQALAGLAQTINSDALPSIRDINQAFREGTSIGEEFEQFIDDLTALVKPLVNRLRNVGIEVAQRLEPGLRKLIGASGKLLPVIEQLGIELAERLSRGLTAIANNLPTVAGQFAAFGSAVKSSLTFIGQLVTAAFNLGRVLGSAFRVLGTAISDAFEEPIRGSLRLIQRIKDSVEDIPAAALSAFPSLKVLAEALPDIPEDMLGEPSKGAQKAADQMQARLKDLRQNLEAMGKNISSFGREAQLAFFRVRDAVERAMGVLVSGAGKATQAIQEIPIERMRRLISVGEGVSLIRPTQQMVQLKDATMDLIPSLESFVGRFRDLRNAVAMSTPQIRGLKDSMKQLREQFLSGAVSQEQFLKQSRTLLRRARELGVDIGGSLSDSMSKTLKRGARRAMESLIEGLLRGRDNILQVVVDIGISIASALMTDGIMKKLGIDSPSKVAIRIGESVGEGLVRGIENMHPNVQGAARRLAGAAVSGMSVGAVSGPFAGGGVPARSVRRPRGGAPPNINSKVEVTINAVDAKSVKRLVRENEDIFARPAIQAMNESLAAQRAAFGG